MTSLICFLLTRCVNILAAFPYRKLDPRHSTPLECSVLEIVSSIDISRLWREETPSGSRTLFAPAEQYIYRKM